MQNSYLNKGMGLQRTFIDNLRYYRKKKKLSQKDLSIMLDKGFNYINCIEGGVSFPPPAMIDKIAEALGIDVELLFLKAANPKNMESLFKEKFRKSLEEKLSEVILRDIKDVCEKI